MEAPQILLDAEEWLSTVNINASTHHENCHKSHSSCMIQRLAEGFRKTLAEIEAAKQPVFAKPPIRKKK